MPRPYVHQCERCGQQASLERTGRFRDEDYLELLHEYFALEHELQFQLMCRAGLAERIRTLLTQRDELRALVPSPVETAPADPEGCPF